MLCIAHLLIDHHLTRVQIIASNPIVEYKCYRPPLIVDVIKPPINKALIFAIISPIINKVIADGKYEPVSNKHLKCY